MIFDLQPALVHPAQLERSKVAVPQPVVNFFEPDVLAREGVRHADPVVVPANAAVAADESDFKVPGVFDRGQSTRQGPRRRDVVRRGRVVVHRLVRALVGVLVLEVSEADLLGLQIA